MTTPQPPVREFRDSSGTLLATLFSWSDFSEGVHFVTPHELQQQVAVMRRPAGEVIPAHTHLPVPRALQGTQEVLVVLSGVIETYLFDEDREHVTTIILRGGDVITLVSGGHGFNILEEAQFLEVKQGPYVPGRDKEVFGGEDRSW